MKYLKTVAATTGYTFLAMVRVGIAFGMAYVFCHYVSQKPDELAKMGCIFLASSALIDLAELKWKATQ